MGLNGLVDTSGIRGGGLQNLTEIGGIPDSVVHHYLTDEGSGTTLFDNVGAIDGTINGATWVTGSGGNGDAYLDYDGVDDYVDFNNAADPHLPETADWTVNCWIDANDLSAERIFFAQYIESGGNGRLILRYGSSVSAFELFVGNDDSEPTEALNSTTTPATNTWYMLSARRSGSTFSIHVNGGSPEASVTDSGTRNILQTGNLIGARSGSDTAYDISLNAYHDGAVDDLWIADAAVSDSELTSYHDDTKGRYP